MRALGASFGYAFRGVARAVRTERNMRIHLMFMAFLYGFLLIPDWFVLSRGQWAALLLANALVIAAELLNTAIEAVVDLAAAGQRHHLAAVAKDTAAGAVLVCALFAVAVGVAVLWQPSAFRALWGSFAAHPVMLGVLGLAIAGAGVFIFLPNRPPRPARPVSSWDNA